MKNKILFVVTTLFLGINAIACCCEPQIKAKAEAIDLHLKTKNEANTNALEKLNENIKKLNEEILANRTTEIKDSELKSELQKFKMNNAKTLYHANSMPTGLLYYQMAKIAHEKSNVVESISNQTDLIILSSKTNLENIKSSIYNTSKTQEEATNRQTEDIFGIKKDK